MGTTKSFTLEEIKVSAELTVVGCLALAQMLESNSSLNNFTLGLRGLDSDDSTIPIAKALVCNSTLQYLSIYGNAKLSRSSQEAFAAMFHKNSSIVGFDVNDL